MNICLYYKKFSRSSNCVCVCVCVCMHTCINMLIYVYNTCVHNLYFVTVCLHSNFLMDKGAWFYFALTHIACMHRIPLVHFTYFVAWFYLCRNHSLVTTYYRRYHSVYYGSYDLNIIQPCITWSCYHLSIHLSPTHHSRNKYIYIYIYIYIYF